MSFNNDVARLSASKLKEAWGGRLPTWDEYKAAVKADTVQVNRSIAMRVTRTAPVSILARVLYGVVLPWLGLLALPAFVVLAALGLVSWWWLLAAAIAAFVLFQVARHGQCEVLKKGAARDEWFYLLMADQGALLFKPR